MNREPHRVKVSRWRALDRLRALAVISMIQGHTFSALLRPDALSAEADRWHAFLHGLTAPAFLFGAGLAFGTATYAEYDGHRVVGSALTRRLRRYLLLLAIGYALQLPGGSLWAAVRAQGEQLALVCRVGPLQLVAVVLGVAQLAALVASTPRRHAQFSAALGLLVALAATRVGRSDVPATLGPFFGAFLADGSGAHFPIFPWAAFLFFGIGCAGVRQERGHVPALSAVAAGALLAGVGYATYHAAAAHNDGTWWWRTSPSYLFFRLGLVVVLLGCLHRRGDAEVQRAGAGPSAMLARHSLVAYVAHLALLYGTPLTPGLASSYGRSLRLADAAFASFSIVVAVVGATWLWHWLEHGQVLERRYKRAGLVLLGLTLLVR